jgi:hypothetical protein
MYGRLVETVFKYNDVYIFHLRKQKYRGRSRRRLGHDRGAPSKIAAADMEKQWEKFRKIKKLCMDQSIPSIEVR